MPTLELARPLTFPELIRTTMEKPILYMTPPCTDAVRAQIDAGQLGMIATPAQGNRLTENGLWCADNGCFTGAYPGDDAFIAWLKDPRLSDHKDRCVFATAPDVVGDHNRTLERSLPMLSRIRDAGYPVAFVAQEGMEYSTWDPWDEIDALFIGGSTEWKLGPEAANLADVASSLGKWVHYGRCNSFKRISYIAEYADSTDGTTITRAPDINLPKVLDWVDRLEAQPNLFQL